MSQEPEKGFLADFWDGVKEGYDEQDKKIEKSSRDNTLEERATEGAAAGAVEGILNPFRWLAAIFR